MEKSLYDYKKNKYEILHQIEDRYFLLNAGKNYYVVDLKGVTSKAFKSVFNKGSERQYDIEAQLKPLTEEAAWRNWKEVHITLEIANILEKENAYFEEQARIAKLEGFSELRLQGVGNSNGVGVSVMDSTGKLSAIKIESENTDLGKLSQDELMKYAQDWVLGYNCFFGNKEKATNFADVERYAQASLTKLLKSSENLGKSLTTGLVENFDKSDYYSGIKAEQALAVTRYIFDYMKKNQISLYSDPKLLGNCDNLKLDTMEYNDIYLKSNLHEEDRYNYIMATNKRKAQNYFDAKDVKLFVPDREKGQEIQNSVVLYSGEGIEICADRYTDERNGSFQCEITVNSEYKFFANNKQVIGKCSEANLSSVSQAFASGRMLEWDNVKVRDNKNEILQTHINENVNE